MSEQKSMEKWVIIASVFGLLGLAIGAFGAHGLKKLISPELIETYKTGVLYQVIHAIVILVIGLSSKKIFNASAIFFSIGIILFSFSLYIYAVTQIKIFVYVTPFGGVSFLVGWLLLIVSTIRIKKEK